MARQSLLLDRWARLAHMRAMDGDGKEFRPPPWVGEGEHRRRLTAYLIRAAYLANNARHFLPEPAEGVDDPRKEHREYGDADLLVERIVGGLLGDDQQIVVDGADADLPDAPVVPPEPEDPGTGATESERLVYEAQQRVWRGRAAEAVAGWEADQAAHPLLAERQDWLRRWADDELFEAKVYENERDGACGLGDGVLVLGWSSRAQRPVVQVWSPDAYFPVRKRGQGFPETVHLVWEEKRAALDGTEQRFLRRTTWELATTAPRRLPWTTDPSTTTCLLTDAEWLMTDSNTTEWDGPAPGNVTYLANEDGQELLRYDTGLDFLPVVHFPGTPSSKEHYGTSVLDRVFQLLDDVAATDTDVQAAAALAGSPMVAVRGAVVEQLEVRAGSALNLPADGSVSVIDLSRSVEALSDLMDSLLDRLCVNAQVPGELLGRAGASPAPSGYDRRLRFAAFEQLIRVLRLTREPKNRLVLKFVQRIAQAHAALPEGPTPTARLVFGSYLPDDLEAVATLVAGLTTAHAASRRTALRMLVDAGADIGDISEELARIEAEDLAGARDLFEATGDDEAVRSRLGLSGESARPEAPPEIVLP